MEPQIEAKMEEGFDELKAMMKQMMEDAATDRAKLESMTEAIQASQKRIEVLEASPKPPPPPPPSPPPPTPQGNTSPVMVEHRVEASNPPPNLCIGSRNR
jgi:hypothetical protein